jgi:hypothetical protein
MKWLVRSSRDTTCWCNSLGLVLAATVAACNGGGGGGGGGDQGDTCTPAGGTCAAFKAGCPPGYDEDLDGRECPAGPYSSNICCMPNGMDYCAGVSCPGGSLCARTEADAGQGTCLPFDGGPPNCGTFTCDVGCICQSTAVPASCYCP